jgi:hypothetical protein
MKQAINFAALFLTQRVKQKYYFKLLSSVLKMNENLSGIYKRCLLRLNHKHDQTDDHL